MSLQMNEAISEEEMNGFRPFESASSSSLTQSPSLFPIIESEDEQLIRLLEKRLLNIALFTEIVSFVYKQKTILLQCFKKYDEKTFFVVVNNLMKLYGMMQKAKEQSFLYTTDASSSFEIRCYQDRLVYEQQIVTFMLDRYIQNADQIHKRAVQMKKEGTHHQLNHHMKKALIDFLDVEMCAHVPREYIMISSMMRDLMMTVYIDGFVAPHLLSSTDLSIEMNIMEHNMSLLHELGFFPECFDREVKDFYSFFKNNTLPVLAPRHKSWIDEIEELKDIC